MSGAEGNSDADFDAKTPEERLDYLRSHGVVVETPADRLKASTPESKVGREKVTFTYVKVPASETAPYEQMTGEGYVAEDCMLTLLKTAFAGGSIDATTARKQTFSQMGQDIGDKGLGALGEAAADGVVETFALVRPAKTNNMCGVYIYLDEVGMLKGLPPNPRARSLAASVGLHGADFFGDVYVGRTQVQPSPMRNVDFALSEMDSSADWMRRAESENFEYGLSMREFKDSIKDKQIGARAPEDEDAEKQGDGYRWSQTDEDAEIVVEVGDAVRAKNVKVTYSAQAISVKIDAVEKLKMDLFGQIRPDDCSWTISKGKLTLQLEKIDEVRWPRLEKVA